MVRSSLVCARLLALLTLMCAACGSDPEGQESIQAAGVDATGHAQRSSPEKVDILFVLDSTAPYGCVSPLVTEQVLNALGHPSADRVDLQLAAVFAAGCRFSLSGVETVNDEHLAYRPASAFPPTCMTSVGAACVGDDDCPVGGVELSGQFDSSSDIVCSSGPQRQSLDNPEDSDLKWRCLAPLSGSMVNYDCSPRTVCAPRCGHLAPSAADAECRRLYSSDAAKCYVPGGTAVEAAQCALAPIFSGTVDPETEGDNLDPIASGAYKDEVKSVLQPSIDDGTVSVPAPLRAAWRVLSGDKHPEFLRDDAWLVVVVGPMAGDFSPWDVELSSSFCPQFIGVSESGPSAASQNLLAAHLLEDGPAIREAYCEYRRARDSSVRCPADCPDGVDGGRSCGEVETGMGLLDGTDIPTLASQYGTIEGWHARLAGLKSDSTHVIFAGAPGRLVPASAGLEADYIHRRTVDYYRAVLERTETYDGPWVCGGRMGHHLYERRLISLIERFGERGFSADPCDFAPYEQLLTRVFEYIRSQATSR